MSDVPEQVQLFLDEGMDLGINIWDVAAAAKRQISELISEVKSIEKSLDGTPAMTGDMMVAVMKAKNSLDRLAALKLAGAKRTRGTLKVWQEHVATQDAKKIVNQLQKYIQEFCETDSLQEINDELGQVLSNVVGALGAAKKTKASASHNMKRCGLRGTAAAAGGSFAAGSFTAYLWQSTMAGGAGKLGVGAYACTVSSGGIALLVAGVILVVGLLVKKGCSYYTDAMLKTKLKRIDEIITNLKELAAEAERLNDQAEKLRTSSIQQGDALEHLLGTLDSGYDKKVKQAQSLEELIESLELDCDENQMRGMLGVAIEGFDNVIKVMEQPVPDATCPGLGQNIARVAGVFVGGAVTGAAGTTLALSSRA